MQEDLLHYLWKFRKFAISELKTTQHETLVVEAVGQHNNDSGPDFFNAKVRIGEQLWAGNVEIHVKSSDWFLHGHEKDPAYDNVILHVVFEHDTDIFRNDNSAIPTFELKNIIPNGIMNNYQRLMGNANSWIYCEKQFAEVDDFIIQHWLEGLYFERLKRKSEVIDDLLVQSKNNWEAVLFKLLAKYTGLKVNGDAFFSMASSFDFAILRKNQKSLPRLEALFFGQMGLLEGEEPNAYFKSLKAEYRFLQQKFQLDNSHVIPPKFFRLRPPNFPTIRLSQLAHLYHQKQQVFSEVIALRTLEDFYGYFDVSVSEFWKDHYTFQKQSKYSEKKLTKSFIDLLLVNVLIPLKFCHATHLGKSIDTEIIELISSIPSEANHIVKGFNNLKPVSQSAMQSQALIELKSNYCDKKACLKCAIGSALVY